MSIKIIAFDLDGTTLRSHTELSEGNKKALIAAKDKGVYIVPCTGRLVSFLPKPIMELPDVKYIISSNGASVVNYETKEPILKQLLTTEESIIVEKILAPYGLYMEYYVDGRAVTLTGNPDIAFSHYDLPISKANFIKKDYRYVPNIMDFLESQRPGVEKINITYLPESVKAEVKEKLQATGFLKLTSSLFDNLEINSTQSTKGTALKWLSEKLGFTPDEVMAIGDSGNDIPMLEFAGCSVAMENATDEAMEAAKFTTCNYKSDGLARAIERFILEVE